jgi:outer membrane immunogenic protein
MKRVLFAGVSFLAVALAGAANAADLPRRAVMPAAAPVYAPAAYNWTGFYAGIVGGWAWGDSSWRDRAGTTGDFDVDGGHIGGTLGYNWQSGQAVFGIETDLSWADISGSTGRTCPVGFGCRTSSDWFGTTRGRLGLAVDRWMPFVTGGLAYGDIHARTAGFPSTSETNAGWTLGAGVEFALAGNWTAKGEYLYVDLGDMNCAVRNCGGAGNTNVEFNTHMLRAGLNYRF